MCPTKINLHEAYPWQELPSGQLPKFSSQNGCNFEETSQALSLTQMTSTKYNTKPVIDFLYLATSAPPILSQLPKNKLPSFFSNRSAFKPLKRTVPQSSSTAETSASSDRSSLVSLSSSSTNPSLLSVPSGSQSSNCKTFSLAMNAKLQSTMTKSCGFSAFHPIQSSRLPANCFGSPCFYLASAGERGTHRTSHHLNDTTSASGLPGLGSIRNEAIPTVSSSTKDDGDTNSDDNENGSVVSRDKSNTTGSISGIISEQFMNEEGKPKRRHKCYYCGKMYSRKYGLKIHIRTHTGYKPLKCKVCLRPFGDPSNLNKHIRLHAEGITPYRCELCGKVLVRRRDLERHLKSRHPNHTNLQQTPNTNSLLNVNDNIETQ